MKKQPAKKRTTTKTKATRTNAKSTKNRVKSWHIIGEWYVAIPLAILIVFVAGYIARGWVRYNAEPKMVSWSMDGSKKVLKEQVAQLGNPFKSMGMPDASIDSQCALTYANGFSSEFNCGSESQSFFKDVRGLKPDLASRGATLQIGLAANNWMGGNTTLADLTSNISKGIDYTPDATYMKQVGMYTCMISFTTAFSKPKPPAIAAVMSCSKQYSILGGAQSY